MLDTFKVGVAVQDVSRAIIINGGLTCIKRVVTADLIMLSVGIEDVADICEDLGQALDSLR